jgi:dienelactone hydrolase
MHPTLSALAIASLLASGCGAPPPTPAAPVSEPRELSDGTRVLDVRFPCAGESCAAWLYLPAGARPPVVVMAHGFAGTRDVALPDFAQRFAAEGVAALVFDYRYFGASGGAPRQLIDPWQQLDDWRAAIAFARAREDVDGTRIAVWGSSQGGGHALIIAAEDPTLRAVVAQAPLVDTSMEGEATFYGVSWAVRLLFTAWADLATSFVGAEPVTLPALAASGEFGMIVDDAAHAAFERLVPPGSSYRNAVAARSILTYDSYNPAATAASTRVPMLLIASRGDRFAPFAAVEALARAATAARLVELEGDHFDVYWPPARDRAAAAAAAFLRENLLAGP